MNALKKSDAVAIALDREISRIDAAARDAGHVLNPWQHDGPTAVCFCKACGCGASIRVYPNESPVRVWSAGRLKNHDCPGKDGNPKERT